MAVFGGEEDGGIPVGYVLFSMKAWVSIGSVVIYVA